jgi:hypothetical protein
MNIYHAITQVMSEIGAVGKTHTNTQQGSGYKFRGIDDLYNATQAALIKAGVFSVPTVLEVTREERTSKAGGLLLWTTLKIKYIFYAGDGSSIEAVTMGEAMDSGDKSCNKAMSAAQKYAFLQVFAIPTEESKDTEHETYEVGKKAPPKQPDKKDEIPEFSDTAEPSAAGDIVILYIEEIEKKEGINAKTKKPWTSWSLKVGNSKWGTFSASVAAAAEKAKAEGKPVEVTYTVKEFAPGKFSNEIVSLRVVDDGEDNET